LNTATNICGCQAGYTTPVLNGTSFTCTISCEQISTTYYPDENACYCNTGYTLLEEYDDSWRCIPVCNSTTTTLNTDTNECDCKDGYDDTVLSGNSFTCTI